MTDRELMQQALEKLEFFAHMKSVSEDTRRLITAMRERLAQPEQDPVATVVRRQYEDGTYAGNALDWAGRNCEDDFPVGTKLYTDPQPVKFNCTVVDDDHPNGVPLSQWGRQPAQEPVAWRGYNWSHSPDDWVYRDFDDPILDGHGNNVGQPLYTSPPQRTWVGLTDDEIDNINYTSAHMLAREVEAKLKEKNT